MTDFGEHTTADEVLEGIDLSGKRAVVTGASTGLGEETTRALAAHGASVTMAVRDQARGDAAVERIRATVPDADLEVRLLELGSLASVREFASGFLADHDRIDLLINNAGIMACPQGVTQDGFELQFGTNHLGHFLLSMLLVPALINAAPSRLIELSSAGHRFSPVDLEDPNFEHTPYDAWVSYGRAKSANALFAVGFDNRFAAQGVRAFSVHPGGIITELGRHLTDETLGVMLKAMEGATKPREMKTVPQGAATTVWAATSPDLDGKGGMYLEDCGIAAVTDDPNDREGVRLYAIDPHIADDLWDLSEKLVGLR
jgi:NAD(P)-dependent dehydrogenase (short-subunit alcohol dehydrogenase family)